MSSKRGSVERKHCRRVLLCPERSGLQNILGAGNREADNKISQLPANRKASTHQRSVE